LFHDNDYIKREIEAFCYVEGEREMIEGKYESEYASGYQHSLKHRLLSKTADMMKQALDAKRPKYTTNNIAVNKIV
jgi:hypothetical protein